MFTVQAWKGNSVRNCFYVHPANLKSIAESIVSESREVIYKELDVTDPEDVIAFVKYAVEKFGTLDVLVNNAGLMPLSTINSYKI